jgi:hypothetical protein
LIFCGKGGISIKNKTLAIFILLITIFVLLSAFSPLLLAREVETQEDGWWFPSTGNFSGHWDLGMGAHIWSDRFDLRNLQLRTDFDLAPGLRFNSILRSNKEFDNLDTFDPNFDQLYLEGYGFHYGDYGKFSASLKVGEVRYLRFPEPDLISYFDHVPGTADLRIDGAETGYSGQLLNLDYETKLGLGYHLTGINWDYGDRDGSNWIENYIYYRDRWGAIDFEGRVGTLALRHSAGGNPGSGNHLGESGPGFNLYLGGNWRGYKVGFLYEEVENEEINEKDIRTGIMVEFAFSDVTELLGKLRFDYTRSPEGIVAHIPLASGEFGYREEQPEGTELVGEVKAERVMTYWQNGQARNFYEHRISKWGNTDPGETAVVMETQPWYLQLEALVSPHTSFSSWDDLKEWESDRQGPAQLIQPVTYKYYR